MQKGNYFTPYKQKNGTKVYLGMGPNDIGKKSIPKKDRCEDFDELWMQVYADVLANWEEVTDIHEFDQYQQVDNEQDTGGMDFIEPTPIE